jgi:hypothetical protein
MTLPDLLQPMSSFVEAANSGDMVLSWRSPQNAQQRELSGSDVRAWAQALMATTQGQWRSGVDTGPIEPSAVRVSVMRRQSRVAMIVLGSTSVHWVDVDGRRWVARVGADQAAALGVMFP